MFKKKATERDEKKKMYRTVANITTCRQNILSAGFTSYVITK